MGIGSVGTVFTRSLGWSRVSARNGSQWTNRVEEMFISEWLVRVVFREFIHGKSRAVGHTWERRPTWDPTVMGTW